jgi:acetyl esterase/lipase
MPVLVFIHGGGWRGGTKEAHVQQLVPFARRGYVCASIEYRLTQEAIFPAQIEDCKCAIRFLRAKAREFYLDPERIGVWGSSAGGHLAALLGTSAGIPELEGSGGWPEHSSRVQAVCDWFGPTDLLTMAEGLAHSGVSKRVGPNSPEAPDSYESHLVGGPIRERPDECRRANPITYITADAPPFLILHGDRDAVVPLNQSEQLAAALREAGVEVDFRVIEGTGHGFDSPEIDAAVEAFFDRHLLSSGTLTATPPPHPTSG